MSSAESTAMGVLVGMLIGVALGLALGFCNSQDWHDYLTQHRSELVELGYGKYEVDNMGNVKFVLIRSAKSRQGGG